MIDTPSDCQQAEALFDRFLDGALEPREERWLSAHLEQCEGCRDELWASRLGRKAREVLVPPEGSEQALVECRERVLAQVEEPTQHVRGLQSVRRWWWVAASAAAIVLAALLTWPSTTPVVEQTTVPVEQAPAFHVEQPRVTSPPVAHQDPQVKERTVTEVRLFWDGVQIVWIFDSHFKP